jgi:hypothetical protein
MTRIETSQGDHPCNLAIVNHRALTDIVSMAEAIALMDCAMQILSRRLRRLVVTVARAYASMSWRRETSLRRFFRRSGRSYGT